ncbi:acylamino-acid-releasing enzyme-like isoform X2 [Ambystoma mexicanum]|uniref:acylamino-acid-releasing enzyme-like isoform X2 n=1 Tax=Ambystoma mexicanum TaxID=8296 RepID=UPI0037E98C71
MLPVDPENIAAVFKDLSQYPSVSKALIGPEVSPQNGGKYRTLRTEWWQRDLECQEHVKFSRQHIVFCEGSKVSSITPAGNCMVTQSELLSKNWRTGGMKAIVRGAGCKEDQKEFLEIWSGSRKIKNVNLTALNKHGPVYTDDQFGCLEWSHAGNRILYVAEKKIPATESYFETTPPKLNSSPKEDKNSTAPAHVPKGDQFVFREDWGEGLVNKSVPVLCILDIETMDISILEGIPDYISPGQALWSPDEDGVLFVGWWHEPFRLGLKFCNNRRSALYHLKSSSGSCELISLDTEAVCSPRLSPDGKHVVYLEAKVSGPHWQCANLRMYDWHLKTNSTVLDVVRRSKAGFSGIYSAGLPKNCWSMDSRRVLVNTPQRSRKVVLVVDTESAAVESITPGGGWTLLTIQEDLLVASFSSPNCPPCVKIGFLPPKGKETEVLWVSVEEAEALHNIEWKILTFQPPNESKSTKYSDLDFEGILLTPQQTDGAVPFPLVVYPHGGPHSVFGATWDLAPAVFCCLGFAVLMVNYRGSTGFGQDSIESLVGRVGQQDVADVQFSVEQVLKSEPLDASQIALYGGSHGGYLCCHLIGQYPSAYKACAVRNPIINFVTLIGSTDIPDWRYIEVGFDYSFQQVPSREALAAMINCSPVIYGPQVKTPLLVLLGEKDRRIAPRHGMEYYRALKDRGVPVRVLWYPDNHSLSSVEAEADGFMNSAAWIVHHLTN